MAQINITIDGKQFRMACEDGQEANLLALANDLDGRIKGIRQSFGDIGDLRLAVMAGLMLADEVNEERRKNAAAQDRLAESRAALDNAGEIGAERDMEIARAITRLTGRVERIARLLNGEAEPEPDATEPPGPAIAAADIPAS